MQIRCDEPWFDAATQHGARARLDNGDALRAVLRLRADCSDGEVAGAAFQRWGAACGDHLRGDWLVVGRDDRDGAVVVRDQHGTEAAYFSVDGEVVRVATQRAALIGATPDRRVDTARLAALIVGVAPPDPTSTIVRGVRSVPRGHLARIDRGGAVVRRYWDASEAMRGVPAGTPDGMIRALESATERRLGAVATGLGLSGGLDSGALAVIAGPVLADRGGRLLAFSLANRFENEAFLEHSQSGDEVPLARVSADAAGAELVPIGVGGLTPVAAMRATLDVLAEPVFAAGNCYWLLDIGRQAAARGVDSLLIASSGNHTITWRGDPFSHGWSLAKRRLGTNGAGRQLVARFLPSSVVTPLRRRRAEPNWLERTALHRQLWEDSAIRDMLIEAFVGEVARDPLEERCTLLRRDSANPLAELCAAVGVSLRDPTADLEVIRAAFAIPDAEHIDPTSGMGRMVIRRAMEGRMPDAVRLNRRFGSQGADLVPRLRAAAKEVDDALDEVARGEGAQFVDVARMRAAWERVQVEDSPDALRLARNIVCRGIMAGLAVNAL